MSARIGIEVGAEFLRAVRLKGRGRPSILAAAEEASGPDELADGLRRLLEQTGTRGDAVLALPDSAVLTRTFTLPPLPREEWQAAIRWKAEHWLPYPPAEASLDFSVLAQGSDGIRVLVMAARKDSLAGVLEACRRAGIEVAGLESAAVALWRAWCTIERRRKDTVRVLGRVTTAGVGLWVLRDAEPLIWRYQTLSARGDEARADEVAGAVRFLVSCFQDRHPSDTVSEIVFWGEGSTDELLRRVGSGLDIPTTRSDVLRGLRFQGEGKADALPDAWRYAVALGAARMTE